MVMSVWLVFFHQRVTILRGEIISKYVQQFSPITISWWHELREAKYKPRVVNRQWWRCLLCRRSSWWCGDVDAYRKAAADKVLRSRVYGAVAKMRGHAAPAAEGRCTDDVHKVLHMLFVTAVREVEGSVWFIYDRYMLKRGWRFWLIFCYKCTFLCLTGQGQTTGKQLIGHLSNWKWNITIICNFSRL